MNLFFENYNVSPVTYVKNGWKNGVKAGWRRNYWYLVSLIVEMNQNLMARIQNNDNWSDLTVNFLANYPQVTFPKCGKTFLARKKNRVKKKGLQINLMEDLGQNFHCSNPLKNFWLVIKLVASSVQRRIFWPNFRPLLNSTVKIIINFYTQYKKEKQTKPLTHDS